MEISIYLSKIKNKLKFKKNTLGSIVTFADSSEIDKLLSQNKYDIAILSVKESRNSKNKGCENAEQFIRKNLYNFYSKFSARIIDIGNILKGKSIDDTYFALKNVVETLRKKNIIPLIIGGSHDLAYPIFLGYENLKQLVNITEIDYKLDISSAKSKISSESYLQKIFLHQPAYLFNYSNIGYQSYYTSPEILELFYSFNFDAYRVGEIQNNIKEAEPIIRNADIVNFDINSVRISDAPSNIVANPNGFDGKEICRLARYAGMSDKLSCFGIFEYNPEYDNRECTAKLIAQIIWYFIDGFCSRKNDFPVENIKKYPEYIVKVNDEFELKFYKSPKSSRWWMEVPYKKNNGIIIPCSYEDYIAACNDNIPIRWWQAMKKKFFFEK